MPGFFCDFFGEIRHSIRALPANTLAGYSADCQGHLAGSAVNVEEQPVEMHVEVQCTAKTLDQRGHSIRVDDFFT